MTKDRYTILKIDSNYFNIFDNESSSSESVAQCRSEDHANLVASALNRCNVLDETEWMEK